VPSISSYRVLVVDDEKEMCEQAAEQIREIRGAVEIHVDPSYTVKNAVDRVKSCVYDLVVLDLYRGTELAGHEFYRRLSELDCSTEIILMTRYDLDASVQALMKLLATRGGPRLVAFFDKNQQRDTNVREEVRKRYDAFVAADLSIEGIELAGRLIDRRRKRYLRPGVFPLRGDVDELCVEVDRLLRELYVEVPRDADRSVSVDVTLSPIERRGLSAAVVVNATVNIGLRGVKSTSSGHKTVLKIGPKPDILEEASRYREFVKYGVELDQRVELLAVAGRDSLGGLVYSFAGGLHRSALVALDEMLSTDILKSRVEPSQYVLGKLFLSRHWYSVEAGDVDEGHYFDKNYRTDLVRSAEAAERELLELPRQADGAVSVRYVNRRGSEDGHFEVDIRGGSVLTLPDKTVLGMGALRVSVPACLVHGDMHAGNVMLEVRGGASGATEAIEALYAGAELDEIIKRVCLIDFRNAGPGPRCVDAVSLESAIRLADGEAVCRSLAGTVESLLDEHEMIGALAVVGGREPQELDLYRSVFLDEGPTPTDAWCLTAERVLRGLKDCFPTLTLSEYLATSIRYTIRQLGFEMRPVSRVRVLCWLSAQYALLRDSSRR
jgi:CheY-like chemotaxis protein